MNKVDFFISYTAADEAWAEWAAFILEEQGYSVLLQKWDFAAGGNFVLEMQRAASQSSRTVGILSPDYLTSKFVKPEWAAAFAKDPEGLKRSLVLVRVRECEPSGLLEPLIYIDLVGLDQDQARERLLSGMIGLRAKPSKRPRFPGRGQGAKSPALFPGAVQSAAPEKRTLGYMPKIRRPPTDLEKRRFIQTCFETVVQHFRSALAELCSQDAAIVGEVKEINATKYVAEIFINGERRAQCKFWMSDGMRENGIKYSETDFGLDSDSSFNEMLSLVHDELALKGIMGGFGGKAEEGLNLERLTPEDAAEYLWRRFTWRLG